jgi:hypothetical protein
MTSYKGETRPPQARDRAAIVTTTILAIVVDALRQWLRGSSGALTDVHTQIENVIRDEFADLARQARSERDILG